MFRSIYKNTWKTLFRSVTFWLAVLVLLGISTFYVYDQLSFYWETAESVQQFLPDFVPEVLPETLVQEIDNAVSAGFLLYQIAIFAVITTVLVLNRDYGDQFFEIEKAAGVSPFRYTAGRMTALLTISVAALEVFSFATLHALLIGKGGVVGQSVFQTMVSTFPRMTCGVVFKGIPHLCFYIGLTYLFGTLFHSGLAGGAAGFAHAIFFYVVSLLYRLDSSWVTYFQYFSPSPNVLRFFVTYVGTPNEELAFKMNGVTMGGLVFCVSFLLGIALLCAAVSYWRTRRREA